MNLSPKHSLPAVTFFCALVLLALLDLQKAHAQTPWKTLSYQLDVSLWPQKHRLQAQAILHLQRNNQGGTSPLKLYLSQMASLSRVEIAPFSARTTRPAAPPPQNSSALPPSSTPKSPSRQTRPLRASPPSRRRATSPQERKGAPKAARRSSPPSRRRATLSPPSPQNKEQGQPSPAPTSAPRSSSLWRVIPFRRTLHTVEMSLPSSFQKQTRLQVRLTYSITFHQEQNALFGQIFCRLDPGDSYFLYNWYPTTRPFADPLSGGLLPLDRFSHRLTLEVPAGEYALSTGHLAQTRRLPSGRMRYTYRSGGIRGAALFFVSGRYKRLVKTVGQTRVLFYLKKSDPRANIDRLARLIARIDRLYRRLFGSLPGTEWRIVSFSASGARGYPFTLLLDETQGYFNEPLQKKLDLLFTRRQIIAHEMAHTWWGNAVTGAGKGSIWLNEGLANYASLRALGALYGPRVEAKARQNHLRYFLQSKGPGWLLEPAGLAQMAQRTAYTKGALLFYELKRKIGDSLQKGLHQFFQRHRHQFVQIDDLRRALERACGCSLQSFFRHWVLGTGLPDVRIDSFRCAPAPTSTPPPPSRWSTTPLRRRPPPRRVAPRQTPSPNFVTTVRLTNSGSLPSLVPLRLYGKGPAKKPYAPAFLKKYSRSRHVALKPGQSKTVTFRTPFRVTRVLFDPLDPLFHGLRLTALISQADSLRRQGKRAKAKRLYQRALRRDRHHGHALYGLARLFEKAGQRKKALNHYLRAARSTSPHSPWWVRPWSRYRAAILLIKAKKKKAAIRLLQQILQDPLDPYQVKTKARRTLQQLRSP